MSYFHTPQIVTLYSRKTDTTLLSVIYIRLLFTVTKATRILYAFAGFEMTRCVYPLERCVLPAGNVARLLKTKWVFS